MPAGTRIAVHPQERVAAAVRSLEGERLIEKVKNAFVYPTHTWHPFLDNAYPGGGLPSVPDT
jgi:hypothetical protein